jgi:hypothetical protein
MIKICAGITCVLLFMLSFTTALGDDYSSSRIHIVPHSGLQTERPAVELREGQLHVRHAALAYRERELYTMYPLLEEDSEYEETPARRFEIIFIISIPMTLALSFAGLAAYKGASDTWGDYQTADYVYLTLSTLSLSFSVALHDHRVVYKKWGT